VFTLQTLPSDWITWGLYTAVLSILFFTLKLVNHRLHHMFDTSEVIEEEQEADITSADEQSKASTDVKNQTQG